MTNFEKWKLQLTVEQAAKTIYFFCDSCPACEICKNSDGDGCENNFKKWANSTVEERNKR